MSKANLDYSYSRISAKCFELSRNHLRNSSHWKLDLKFFSQTLEDPRSSSDRSLCVGLKPPTTNVHVHKNFYDFAFPPLCLVGNVLTKAMKQRAQLLIITPAWQTQPWYTTLLLMSVADLILLPNSKHSYAIHRITVILQ